VLSRQIDGIGQGDNAQLATIRANDTDLTGTDFPVDSDVGTRRRRSGRKRAAQAALTG
jgi:hypothetical protein